MTHPRKALRAAFKAKLLNVTAAADRVFATMTPPIDIEDTLVGEGPVIMVYARHEEIREEDYPKSMFDGGVRRRLEISIEALVAGTDVDDTLDDMAEQIEGLIEGWDIPGFLNAEILLVASQIDVSDTQERIVGGLFMSYHVKYWAPYRTDTSDDFIASFVSTRAQAAAPGAVTELLEDGEEGQP